MPLPIKRVFDEKRRVVLPLLAGLALNIALYVVVVYPISVRERGAEARAEAAARELQAAETEDANARATLQGRDRTDAALKAFYKDVLPASFSQARNTTYLRLAQLAAQHNLQQSQGTHEIKREQNSPLARLSFRSSLKGDYDDIRRFIYQLESGTDFIVIDSISLQQGSEPGSPLELSLELSTYFREGTDGA